MNKHIWRAVLKLPELVVIVGGAKIRHFGCGRGGADLAEGREIVVVVVRHVEALLAARLRVWTRAVQKVRLLTPWQSRRRRAV